MNKLENAKMCLKSHMVTIKWPYGLHPHYDVIQRKSLMSRQPVGISNLMLLLSSSLLLLPFMDALTLREELIMVFEPSVSNPKLWWLFKQFSNPVCPKTLAPKLRLESSGLSWQLTYWFDFGSTRVRVEKEIEAGNWSAVEVGSWDWFWLMRFGRWVWESCWFGGKMRFPRRLSKSGFKIAWRPSKSERLFSCKDDEHIADDNCSTRSRRGLWVTGSIPILSSLFRMCVFQ